MNYLPEIAKMLGVSIGEKFNISEWDNIAFCFTEDQFLASSTSFNMTQTIAEHILASLICGTYTIKRQPWQPKNEEKFWMVEFGTKYCYVCEYTFYDDCACDINFYKLGNCYRTREEAEANIDKWKAFYNSDEVLEVISK